MKDQNICLLTLWILQLKGKRYYSSDELVDSLKDNFVGQIGMRIMQRPKSDKLFESEEEKAEFMNRIYIENVWCFSKEKIRLL